MPVCLLTETEHNGGHCGKSQGFYWRLWSGSRTTAERKSTCSGFNFLILRHHSVKPHKSPPRHLMKQQGPLAPAIAHLLQASCFYSSAPQQQQEKTQSKLISANVAGMWTHQENDWSGEREKKEKPSEKEGRAAVCSDFCASLSGPSGGEQQFLTNLCTLLLTAVLVEQFVFIVFPHIVLTET